jgi:hypothetical protein
MEHAVHGMRLHVMVLGSFWETVLIVEAGITGGYLLARI